MPSELLQQVKIGGENMNKNGDDSMRKPEPRGHFNQMSAHIAYI